MVAEKRFAGDVKIFTVVNILAVVESHRGRKSQGAQDFSCAPWLMKQRCSCIIVQVSSYILMPSKMTYEQLMRKRLPIPLALLPM
jgi:hypothetical protein